MTEIERLRTEKGWSKRRLAREAGVDERAVRKWERGGVANARYGLMRRVAMALDVPMEDLDRGPQGGWDGSHD